MRLLRSLGIATQWIVAALPLNSLGWFWMLALWIHSESGCWPQTFLDDAEHYGYNNQVFEQIFDAAFCSALLTVLCAVLLFATLVSLWSFEASSSYRRNWCALAALSWSTLLFPAVRNFYSILTG